ncbi:alpha/beta fold hydrolase [Virgibacillus halodenitrificans]|uniref:alpha/beta hydrolase n=1 Tax=Virgibacillus halodenitrificans TaxID=1482 RepID=UPI001371DABB|nr:alpha/beta hydrolase [Virgibacillus halodenitrificans]MYL46392.1 alpha/beta fold hydrolase [Virgibacillus halodenitrificans]
MKSRTSIILLCAIGVLIIVAVIYFFQETESSSAGPSTNEQILLKEAKTWSENLEPDTLKLISFDELTLKAAFVTNGSNTKNVAILAHGFGSTKEDVRLLAKFYYDQEFNILMPDSRGNGDSKGNVLSYDWHDHLVVDMVDWIHMMINEYGAENIILHGESMGAAVVLGASGKNLPPEVKGIVADSSYTSVKKQLTYLGEEKLLSKMESGFRLEKTSAVEQVTKNTRPIFTIHGKADNSVPTEMGQRIYDAAGGDKRIWLVPGADHLEVFETVTEEFYERVGAFINDAID